MKYQITESRLGEFMKNYLDSFLENKAISQYDSFIIIQQKAYNDEDWEDYMEYDYTDGRLWVSKTILKHFMDLFGYDKTNTSNLIKDWFSDKFNVDVKFVES